MDFLQLIFGFVNAPLFATFLLGMFWKRTTGHGAFWGLLVGTAAAVAHVWLTARRRQRGWIANLHEFPSVHGPKLLDCDFRLDPCLVVTFMVSLVTRPKPNRNSTTWSRE